MKMIDCIILRFEIHDIEKIHEEEDVASLEKIYLAANHFIQKEERLNYGIIIKFIGPKGYLSCYTTYPIIISRSDKWIDHIVKKWKDMAISILGHSCRPIVEVITR